MSTSACRSGNAVRTSRVGRLLGYRKEFRRVGSRYVSRHAHLNLIAIAIMTTAATLHVNGVTDIQSSSQAAEALKPIAGQFAELVFALGIVGTGLLAIPVLAGSTASLARGGNGLARKPKQAVAFLRVVGHFGVTLNFYQA